MRKRPLLVFHREGVTVNIGLDAESVKELRGIWETRVEGVQPPLVEGSRDGLHIHIPWVLKKS